MRFLPARSLLFAGLALVAASAFAEPITRGEPITVKKPLKIARLAKEPAQYVGKEVRLEGTVKAVCQGRGCWVEVQDAKGASFLVKSLDESILLPKDCAGRPIVVQGVVTELTPDPAEKEHAEAEGHACPQPTFVVSTRGVVLK